LALFAKRNNPIDFDKINAHVVSDSHVTSTWLATYADMTYESLPHVAAHVDVTYESL
jgi:hypothetical protein